MSFLVAYKPFAQCNDGLFPALIMLTCCCKKKTCPPDKRILYYPSDHLNLSWDGFSDSETSSLDKSFEFADMPTARLTSLNTVQPNVQETLALRRTYSTEDDSGRSRSSSFRSRSSSVRSRSDSSGIKSRADSTSFRSRSSSTSSRSDSPSLKSRLDSSEMRSRAYTSSGSTSVADRFPKFNRQFSSISVMNHSQQIYPKDTYPIDVSRITTNIKDYTLPSTEEQDDEFESPLNTSSPMHQEDAPKIRCQVETIQQKKGFVLKVLVKDVIGLPYKGRGLLYDPILVISLQPGSYQTQHSHPALQTLNPSFQQTFTFVCKSIRQRRQSVRITVYDSARKKEFMEIGHAILSDIEDICEESIPQECQLLLSKSSRIHANIGELFMSFSYSRKDKSLSVGLLRGRHLALKNEQRYTNTDLRFKVTLLLGGDKVTEKDSRVISHFSCPFINEFFVFYVPRKFFDEVTVVVSLVERGLLSHSVIGRAIIGPYDQRSTSPMNYWGLVIQSGRTIKDWYHLRL